MNKICELLNLSETEVQNLADVYSGYARVLEEQSPEDISIASSWVIGAVFESLISTEKAKQYFKRGAKHYRKSESPLASICAICALNFDHIELKRDTIQYTFFQALYKTLTHDNEMLMLENVHNELPGYIPNLNIPYQLVVHAIIQINLFPIDSGSEIFKSIEHVLRRLFELIDLYKTNEHWQRLEGPIIPYEPAAMAIAITLLELLRRRKLLKKFLIGLDLTSENHIAFFTIALSFVTNDMLENYLQHLNNKQ